MAEHVDLLNGAGWNAATFNTVLAGAPAYSTTCATSVNHGILMPPFNTDQAFVHMFVVSYGRLRLSAADNPELEEVALVAAGDLFGLNVNTLDQEAAQALYLRAVRKFLVAENAAPLTAVIPPEAPNDRRVFEHEQPHMINAFRRGNNDYVLPTTFVAAYDYVQNNLNALQALLEIPSRLEMLVNVIVSVCKTGTVSARFITKVVNSVELELHQDIEMNSKFISRFYSTFVRQITPAAAREFFTRIGGWIPQVAMRVSLIVTQAAEHGITSLMLITRALAAYPTFNWALVDVTRPGEMARVNLALLVWNGDEYAGFTRNMGNLSATKYKLATYTAKELLRRIGGETTLRQYKGGERGPIEVIDNAITAYIDERDRLMNENANANDPIMVAARNGVMAVTATLARIQQNQIAH